MSYLKSKLNEESKIGIRDYLLSEGFEPFNGVFPNILTYFAQGATHELSITVNMDDKTLKYYVEYRHGGGTVHEEIINYTNNLGVFEEEYKNFVDKATLWVD